MKKITIGALTAATIALIPLSASAQTRDQLRSCRNYVASVPEFANSVSASAIDVSGGGTNANGNAVVNWRIPARRISGTCLVNRRNVVVGYQKEQGDYGSNPDVQYRWGEEVRPYRARVEGGQARELLDRPNKRNSETVARVTSGEVVIVYRSYVADDTTWVLVRGAKGQEGWINSRRLTGAKGGYGNNPDVNYDIGQEIRPYRDRIESGSERELLDRPGKNNVKIVDRVPGGDRVRVYRTHKDSDTAWLLVKGSDGQEGWINSRRLEGSDRGDYGNKPNVDYDRGEEVRPYRARIEAGPARELLNRPDKDNAKVVDRVQGGERITVYRTYNDGDIDWVLIKGANEQEGWINSNRLR
jgi:SH3-like domain-containing protein